METSAPEETMYDRYMAFEIQPHALLSGTYLDDLRYLRQKYKQLEEDDLEMWQHEYCWRLGHHAPPEDVLAFISLIHIARMVIREYNLDLTSSDYHDAIGELDAELCRLGFEPERPAPIQGGRE